MRRVRDDGGMDPRGPSTALDASTRAALDACLDAEGVVAAFVFGSGARGRAGPLSDVDIGLWVDPALDPKQRLDLQLRLMAEATAVLGGREPDLVVLNEASPLLRHRALQGRQMLVERDRARRVQLEAAAIVEFLDTAPLRAELARGLRHRVAEGRLGRP